MERPKAGHPIKVSIGDRNDLELKFPLKVMKELDANHGISVLTGLGESFSRPAIFSLILWHGLKTKQADITLEWLEENVDATDFLRLAPYVTFACTGRWVDVEKAVEAYERKNALSPEPEPGMLNGTPGLPSGPLDVTTLDSPNPSSGN